MNGNEFSNFKRGLLSSGLPLEFDVAKHISKLDPTLLKPDFTFTRKNQENHEVDFSVDFAATFALAKFPSEKMPAAEDREDHETHVNLKLLVECKYCRTGVSWVFLPALTKPATAHPCFSVIDEFSDEPVFQPGIRKRGRLARNVRRFLAGFEPSRIYREDLRNPYDHTSDIIFETENTWPFATLHLCSRGFELRDKEPNPRPILEGIKQLQYGHTARMADDLPQMLFSHMVDGLPILRPINIYAGLLVTTARLFVLKQDVDLSRIEDSTNQSEIADETSAVEIEAPYSTDLFSYRRQAFSGLADIGPDQDVTPRQRNRLKKLWTEVSEWLTYEQQSFHVVHLKVLEEFLRGQIAGLKRRASHRIEVVVSEVAGPAAARTD